MIEEANRLNIPTQLKTELQNKRFKDCYIFSQEGINKLQISRFSGIKINPNTISTYHTPIEEESIVEKMLDLIMNKGSNIGIYINEAQLIEELQNKVPKGIEYYYELVKFTESQETGHIFTESLVTKLFELEDNQIPQIGTITNEDHEEYEKCIQEYFNSTEQKIQNKEQDEISIE